MKMRMLMIFALLSASLVGVGQEGSKGQERRSPVMESQARVENLSCALLTHPESTLIGTARPVLGWEMHSDERNDRQTAYEILLSSSRQMLNASRGDVWHSGKCITAASSNITYGGRQLASDHAYYWKVRIWDRHRRVTSWSAVQTFRTGRLDTAYMTSKYPVVVSQVKPVVFKDIGQGHYFIDFGRAAFGTLMLKADSAGLAGGWIKIGEKLDGPAAVDTTPPGSIRAYSGPIATNILPNTDNLRYLILPAFNRPNWADPAAHIRIPSPIKDIMPFRYVELVGLSGQPGLARGLDRDAVRQLVVAYPWDEEVSDFHCSNDTLNQIWALCKHSIHATTYAGVYVDGDRERTPYEADAYINQLGHYCTDREYALGRYSYEYFFDKPTWPTEWRFHSVLMAWQDYMYTGNKESLAHYYDQLKRDKLDFLPTNEDGLISDPGGAKLRDIVDWPQSERDDYDLKKINLVPNAFFYAATVTMSRIAGILDRKTDSVAFAQRASRLKTKINELFLDLQTGVYRDAIGSTHSSLHANLFPLAFGLVPPQYKKPVIDLIKRRKMACSVYAAQYLLDGLYEAGEGDYALTLLTDTGKRSWWNMIRVGSTMTLEAWDITYKPNLDWNHAWGAAPANIIPRRMLGIQPLTPGFDSILIRPQTGNLTELSIKTPTIKGPVYAEVHNRPSEGLYILDLRIPANTVAVVCLPRDERRVFCNGKELRLVPEEGGRRLCIGSGKTRIELR